ncbi:MAG: hypothetical protein ACRC7O_02330 [Fimbriiglobus sp.]
MDRLMYAAGDTAYLTVPIDVFEKHFDIDNFEWLGGDPPDPMVPFARCIFGNPFRPVKLAAKHRTPTVVALADAITADGAFDRLPILADAFEEAGCDDADILGHARGPGSHVRGCWVVDLVRGVHWQPRRK